jgi:hypothetical protein
LGKELDSLHEIEGALERFRREVLPELTAELLSEAQAAAIKDPKKSAIEVQWETRDMDQELARAFDLASNDSGKERGAVSVGD